MPLLVNFIGQGDSTARPTGMLRDAVETTKGLSQKYLIFFLDSPKWEKGAGISPFFRDISQNTVYQRRKVGDEKGAICF